MRTRFPLFAAALAALCVSMSNVNAQTAPPAAFNFQGRVTTPNGNPVADGIYSVKFSFYDAANGGSLLYEKTIANIAVKNGAFAVVIDGFTADKFNGNAWMGIKVGNDTELSPRTQIVSVPYALKSSLALSVPDGSVTNAKLAGNITGDKLASGTLNGTAWLLGGNSGVTSGFLGTTDTNPLEFRVNGRRAMRYKYAENLGDQYRGINILGGSEINSIAEGVIGATIAGGGWDFIPEEYGNYPNAVTRSFGTIGGGAGNTASGFFSTVAGGEGNIAGGYHSVIAGGTSNNANGFTAAIAGGSRNTAGGSYSIAAGGNRNAADGDFSMAAGSQAKANHHGTFVWQSSPGFINTNDFASTDSGQFLISAYGGVGINTNTPNGYALNVNGSVFVQNGIRQGASDSVLIAKDHNPFTSGAKAGTSGRWGLFQEPYTLFLGMAGSDYGSTGRITLGGWKADSTREDYFTVTNAGSVGIGNINPEYKLDVNGNARVTVLTQSSDVRYKTHIETLPNALETLLNLRGVTFDWNREQWKERGFPVGRQIGFIAQEVEKIFPELVSTDSSGYKSVAYANLVPVLVEAVKTLNARTVIQHRQNDALKTENAELNTRLSALETAVAELKMLLEAKR